VGERDFSGSDGRDERPHSANFVVIYVVIYLTMGCDIWITTQREKESPLQISSSGQELPHPGKDPAS